MQNPKYMEKTEELVYSISNALLKRRAEQKSNYYQLAQQEFINIFKEYYFGESFIYIDDEKQCIVRAVRCFLLSKNKTTLQSLVHIFKVYLLLNHTDTTTIESNEILNRLIATREAFCGEQ